jgi:trehalose 6-phosphate synthase
MRHGDEGSLALETEMFTWRKHSADERFLVNRLEVPAAQQPEAPHRVHLAPRRPPAATTVVSTGTRADDGGHAANNLVDLFVVANRLPVRLDTGAEGGVWRSSPGGLVSALTPALSERGGAWVGWSGSTDDVTCPEQYEGMRLHNVALSASEYEDFYLGFSNATLWPLYHDAIRTPRFERRWWQAYVEVNTRYAQAAASMARPGATVWVHDYQLQLVPKLLRQIRPDLNIGFFLHIPFPPQELFLQLPWRSEILEGMTGADLVGFQVPGAASNFARLTRRIIGATGTDSVIRHEDRQIKVAAFPISVDTRQLTRIASDPNVQARAKQIRSDLGDPEFVMLGVDRLDYTKGIDLRIRALDELYQDGSLDPSRHVMVQIASPSRDDGPHYQRERHHLEQLVGEVNGEHSRVGRPAINYIHQSLAIEELVALYLAADAMLVTPLRDGMNLVAKEYVTCRLDGAGVLVLSEFAGAAIELRGAISVNPHDLDGIKQALRDVVRLSPDEIKGRMRRNRRVVHRHDVHYWADSFLAALREAAPADRTTGRPQ